MTIKVLHQPSRSATAMSAEEDGFKPHDWLPHERPSLPGSSSTPLHLRARRWAYGVVGFIVALTGALGNALVTANLAMLAITQNRGGLLGTALVGTVLSFREKYHSGQRVEHLTLFDPQVGPYARTVGAPAALTPQGPAVLGAGTTREANVPAYNDVFLLIAAVASLELRGMPVLHFMKPYGAVAAPKPSTS